MTIQTHLQIVGLLLMVLGGANVVLPRHFGWKQDLAAVPMLTRRVFWVHLVFLILTLEMFGCLTYFYAGDLLRAGSLGAAILLGMALFWWTRFFFQWFVYDRELWVGNSVRTRIHYGVSLFWLYLAGTYTAAGWRGLSNLL